METTYIVMVINVLVLVISWFIKQTLREIKDEASTVSDVIDEMLKEVKITNGRVTRLETQIVDHNLRDDDRFRMINEKIDRSAFGRS